MKIIGLPFFGVNKIWYFYFLKSKQFKAASNGHESSVELLLQKGANINLKSKNAETGLSMGNI